MTFEDIKALVTDQLGDDCILVTDTAASPQAFYIEPLRLSDTMQFLHENDQLYFDSLSCISALDNGVESGTMELAYNLYSIPFDHHLMVKVTLDRKAPKISSLTSIWRTADWHEREAFDLMGITFEGHPYLRRILMPADWEGHPLRKDYEEQTYYRGVKVKY